ncbi:cytochrome c3 family protein [bacterium]|nr:cytochrome c3 family protein [bacterium]
MRNSLKIMLPVSLAASVLLVALGLGAMPRREDAGVTFSHKLHLGMGIECNACHAKADSSRLGTDDLMPVQANCLECHGEQDLKGWTTRTDSPRMGRLVKDYSPKFTHARHVEEKIDCQRCHVGIAESDSSSTTHMPVMALCMHCHDGVKAGKECSLCHIEPNGPRPADHVMPAWSKQHGDKARMDNGAACTMCHERNDCQQCHQGDNLLPRVHPIGFEHTHPLEVRSQRTDCAACHEDRSFCIQCHQERQVYPRSHQRAAWAVAGSGGAHAAQAKANIEQCAACHADDPSSQPVCAACHGR